MALSSGRCRVNFAGPDILLEWPRHAVQPQLILVLVKLWFYSSTTHFKAVRYVVSQGLEALLAETRLSACIG